MKILTSVPLMNNHDAIVLKIASFWNKISLGWKEIWGPHIHHGYYESKDTSTPLQAQEKLIKKLADYLNLKPSQKILDVGCGMGGSSLFLAKNYGVESIGITLSQEQLNIAQEEVKKEAGKEIEKRAEMETKKEPQSDSQDYSKLKVSYQIQDAHDLSQFPDNSFDVVWSLESCEQFYDKKLFFTQVHRVLKPEGKFMLATWCSDQEYYEDALAKKYVNICKAFDLPYMPTIPHYLQLLQKYFSVNFLFDWTLHVKQSWSLGMLEVKKHSLLKILKLTGITGWFFSKNIKLINDAFNTGRMIYGVFILSKK